MKIHLYYGFIGRTLGAIFGFIVMIFGCQKNPKTNKLKGQDILSMDGLEVANDLSCRKKEQEFQDTSSLSKFRNVNTYMDDQDVPIAAKYREPFAKVLHDGTFDQAVGGKETDMPTDISIKGSVVENLEHEIRKRINSAVVKLTDEMRKRLEQIGNKTN